MLKQYSRALDLLLASVEMYRQGRKEQAARMFVRAAIHPRMETTAGILDRANEIAAKRDPKFSQLLAKARKQIRADADSNDDLELDQEESEDLYQGDPAMPGDADVPAETEADADGDEDESEEDADIDESVDGDDEEEQADADSEEDGDEEEGADGQEGDSLMMGADGFGEDGVESKAVARARAVLAKAKKKAKKRKKARARLSNQNVARSMRNLRILARLSASYRPIKK